MANLVPTDEMPAGAGVPTDEMPAQAAPQGDASHWGPTTEILNGAMMGNLPAAEGWVSNHLPQGWMPGGQQIQADRDAYAAQHTYISGVANATGGAVPYMAAGEALAPAGLVGRMAGMAGTGAALNGGSAALNGQDPTVPALTGAAAGAGGELGATALTSAGGKLADAILNRGVNVPSSSALRSTANGQYDALQNNPASMSLAEGQKLGQDTLSQLGSKWLDGTQTAKQFSALTNPPSGATSVTAGGLESARQNLNAIMRGQPGTPEAAAARLGKQNIDALVAAKAASDPDWASFASDAASARGNWQSAKGSDTITGATNKAVGRAATNLVDNSPQLISKRAQSLLENPRLTQGFSQDTLDQIGDVAHPSAGRKLLSTVGAMGGHTGVGLSTAVPVALLEAMQHGLTPETVGVGLGAAGLGVATHALNTALAKRGMNAAAENVRMASPAFRDAVSSGASTAPIDVGPTQDAARRLAAALGASGGQQLTPQAQ
jgi:hypothetical protein